MHPRILGRTRSEGPLQLHRQGEVVDEFPDNETATGMFKPNDDMAPGSGKARLIPTGIKVHLAMGQHLRK